MSKVLSALIAKTGKTSDDFRSNSKIGEIFRIAGVQRTPEFERILRIPKRNWEDLLKDGYLETLSAYLRTPNGKQTLRPAQCAVLTEFVDYRGAIGALGLGHGKCVCANTEIFDIESGRRRLAKERGRFKVIAKNDEGQLKEADAVVFPSGEKECVRLSLTDGTHIDLSTDHPVYTYRGYVEAANLNITDFIGVARRIPPPLWPSEIPDEHVVLIAYLLSDGGISQGHTSFTNMSQEIIDECLQLSRKISGVEPKRKFSKSKAQEWYLNGLNKFRHEYRLFGLAKSKRMPAELWGLSEKQIWMFLNRFWSCDGWFSKSQAACTLASEKLIDDLLFMLLRVGIKASKSACEKTLFDHPFKAWTIMMYGENAVQFAEGIGYIRGKEEARQKTLQFYLGKKRNSNIDILPIGMAAGKEIASELGLPLYKLKLLLSVVQDQMIGRSSFIRFCQATQYSGKYAWLAKTDLFWTKVKRVENIGKQKVYDVSVPAYGNFVGNGVVLHNTLLLGLAPTLLSCQRPVIIGPAKLRKKTARDFKKLREDWLIHPKIEYISYETLGRVKNVNLLEELNPDGMFFEECAKIRSLSAARTKNIRRFKKKHPEVPMLFLSGTPWSRSLRDVWHLMLWALPAELMPMPRNYVELQEWCNAVDEKIDPQDRVQAGALLELAKGVEAELGVTAKTDLERARLGLQRRFKATAGYVATTDSGVEASITIEHVKPPKVKAIDDALEELRETWSSPNGEELDSALAVWQYAQCLAFGYYPKWVPPPPKVWKDARKSWARYVRKVLQHSQNWQSPFHVSQGVDSGKLKEPHTEPHPTDPSKSIEVFPKKILENWRREKAAYSYIKEAVWIDTTRLKWVADTFLKKTKKEDPFIVWCYHIDIAEKLAQISGAPYCHNLGLDAKGRHIEDLGGQSVIASITACGEGMNLQHSWYRNVVLEWPTKGETCEQLLGRTHRSGQKEDVVEVYIPDTCQEQENAFEQSLKDAQYQESIGGDMRRLLMADKV